MDAIDRDVVFDLLTKEYRYAKGEARVAYRKAIDIVLDAESISDIGENIKLLQQLQYARRLLRLAIADFPDLADMWRYADEVMKLIGEDSDIKSE